MPLHNLVLGSAASLAFAGLLLSTAPSYAHHDEEFASAIDHARAHGQIADYGTAVAQHNQALAEHSAAQAQYQAQLRDYQARYGTLPADPPAVVITEREPTIVIEREPSIVIEREPSVVIARERLTYPDGHEVLLDLDQIPDPDAEIGGAPVEDRTGRIVGHFRHLSYQDEGQEKAVIMLHSNNKQVAVSDEHFRYDPDEDVVVADMSFDELNAMPARF